MLVGAQKLSKAVSLTMGPGGRSVMIDPWNAEQYNELSIYPKPIITKDGVTVASNINMMQNQLHNIGSKLFIDAAKLANEQSGDGTTSCTIIA